MQTAAPLTVNEVTAALDWESENVSETTQHDTWLMSFIDILILLLALFVLLLTYQENGTGLQDKADQDSAEPVIETAPDNGSFRLALELPLRLSTPATVAEIFDIAEETAGLSEESASALEIPVSPTKNNTVQSIEPLMTTDTDSDDGAPAELQEMPSQPAEEPIEVFLDSLDNSALRDRVEVSVHSGGVNLEISDSILFTPANAALTPSGMAVLEELAGELKAQPYRLSIEGHTDNIPIETARFPSNWELSTARAAIVARHLVERGVSAGRIRAIGYADTRPRAENLTAEGRSRNRRVSLVLLAPSGQY